MPVVRLSSPTVTATRVVSSPIRDYAYYNSPFEYRGYGYPYRYGYYNYGYGYPLYNSSYYAAPVYSTPIYQTPVYQTPATTVVVAPPVSSASTYGTCKAVSGVGVTSNQCSVGKTAVSVANNGCVCADQTTGISGCGNVLNGVCK